MPQAVTPVKGKLPRLTRACAPGYTEGSLGHLAVPARADEGPRSCPVGAGPAGRIHGGWQMSVTNPTRLERLLTWLGLWGALRTFVPLLLAQLVAIGLFESLLPSASRLFPRAPLNFLHFMAVGAGLLCGLLGHFAGEFWDRVLFEGGYGLRGRWRDATTRPLGILPPGGELNQARAQAAQTPSLKDAGEGIYWEAVKLARRQAERWERIEQPLLLSRIVRSLLCPILAVAGLAALAALAAAAGPREETPRLLAVAGSALLLGVLLLAPYTRFRLTHMLRLYQDVAAHQSRRKSDRR